MEWLSFSDCQPSVVLKTTATPPSSSRWTMCAQACQRLARHDPSGDLGDRPPDRLGDERHRATGARVDLDQIYFAILDRELDVHQPPDLERQRELARLPLDLRHDVGRKAVGRNRAGAVARM